MLGLRVSLYADRTWYLERKILDSEGNPATDYLRFLDLGSDLRVDWTRTHRWYLFIEGSGGYTFSNDTDEIGWRARMYGGVEFSF